VRSVEGLTVLVVDDDGVFRERLGQALRSRGLKAVTASDADAALDVALTARPELAVVDQRMPGRSGLELLGELRARYPEMRVVLLTGFGDQNLATAARLAGAVAVLHYACAR
jgi:two-component system response regulator RegA